MTAPTSAGGDGVIVDPDLLDHWRTGMVVDGRRAA